MIGGNYLSTENKIGSVLNDVKLQHICVNHGNTTMHLFCIAALHVILNNTFTPVLLLATIIHT